MAGERARGPRRGSRRVEGWVFEVINPILDALPGEIALLDAGNVTWRFLQRRLEFIRPIAEYLTPDGLHILRDFGRAHADVPGHVKEHDRLVDALTRSAAHAHERLLAREDFRASLSEFLTEYWRRFVDAEKPWGAFSEDQFPALVAEHVVNRTREIPSHHTDSKFWQVFGARLLSFDDDPAFEELDASRKSLANFDRRFAEWLEDKRFALCEEYDIPAAPLSVWTRQPV